MWNDQFRLKLGPNEFGCNRGQFSSLHKYSLLINDRQNTYRDLSPPGAELFKNDSKAYVGALGALFATRTDIPFGVPLGIS